MASLTTNGQHEADQSIEVVSQPSVISTVAILFAVISVVVLMLSLFVQDNENTRPINYRDALIISIPPFIGIVLAITGWFIYSWHKYAYITVIIISCLVMAIGHGVASYNQDKYASKRSPRSAEPQQEAQVVERIIHERFFDESSVIQLSAHFLPATAMSSLDELKPILEDKKYMQIVEKLNATGCRTTKLQWYHQARTGNGLLTTDCTITDDLGNEYTMLYAMASDRITMVKAYKKELLDHFSSIPKIAAVTDLDKDAHFEIWFTGTSKLENEITIESILAKYVDTSIACRIVEVSGTELAEFAVDDEDA